MQWLEAAALISSVLKNLVALHGMGEQEPKVREQEKPRRVRAGLGSAQFRQALAPAHALAVNLAAILIQFALHLGALAACEVASVGAALGPFLALNASVICP